MDFESLTGIQGGGMLLYAWMFVIAFLYASVGHGGASGYLAVLSFFSFSHTEMASTALMLNVLVAGLAFYAYWKGGYFSWRLSWPFMLTSIPAAFIGGLMKLPPKTYSVLLALTLLFAAFRLVFVPSENCTATEKAPSPSEVPLIVSTPMGALIGLLSGMVGVGGGIFLSPLILLLKWADVKSTAATSALFIVVNAAAGLLGRASRNDIMVGNLLPLLVVCAVGGWLGSYLGAHRFSGLALRRLLALVLLIAAVKLLILF